MAAIVVGTYVGGSRCFWVIRVDGSVEDFSIRNCFYPSRVDRYRSPDLLAKMRSWDLQRVVRRFQAALRALAA